MNIFIPIVGQFTNVGDTLHRRILLSWLKDVGTLHVYIGKAPDSFVSGLNLPSNVKVYRSLSGWLWQLLLSGYKKTAFIFNPGEMTFRKKRLRYEFLLVPFLFLTKVKKGKILRVGVAAKSNIRINFVSVWKYILSLSSEIYWRTIDSKEQFGFGKVIPDLGFAESKYMDKHEPSKNNRNLLVVSMRADRRMPGDGWISGIREVSKKNRLTVCAISQVKMDNKRTAELSRVLNGDLVVWDDTFNHIEQEDRVRELYSRAKIVVSDRLHVLIAAATEGCIPSCILTETSNKVKHHFDVIGFNNVELFSEKSEDIVLFLEKQLLRHEELCMRVHGAQSRLGEIKVEIQRGLIVR